MPTGFETILAEVEDRATTPTPFVGGIYGVRRKHQTEVTESTAPGAWIVAGDDEPARVGGISCGTREGDFTVPIFVRSDDGFEAADPFIIVLYARLNDPSRQWPRGVVITPTFIRRPPVEIADSDCVRVDCGFRAKFETQGPWSLELAS